MRDSNPQVLKSTTEYAILGVLTVYLDESDCRKRNAQGDIWNLVSFRLFVFSSQNYRTPCSCLAPVELLRRGKGTIKTCCGIFKDDLV